MSSSREGEQAEAERDVRDSIGCRLQVFRGSYASTGKRLEIEEGIRRRMEERTESLRREYLRMRAEYNINQDSIEGNRFGTICVIAGTMGGGILYYLSSY
ncbi:MAG: hypothetical protein Q8P81_01965 [Nanoarchaeota archaeon]|nr:hypothetical protein [Nanoarchaeota archaeon]